MNWTGIDWVTAEAWLRDQFINNEFLAGGLVVVLLTALLAYARSIPWRIWSYCKRLIHTNMHIYNDDLRPYNRMLFWLGSQPKIMSRNRNIQCDEDGCHLFGVGSSWFFYKWRLIKVNRYRKEDTDTGTLSSREGISFTMWGRNQKLLMNLMDQANKLAEGDKAKLFVEIYTALGNEWQYDGSVIKRHLDSVVLKTGQMEMMIDRIQIFENNKMEYRRLGVPHRLGIMLEGPPGTGKTSTILALASHFDAVLKIINLSGMDDKALTELCSGGRQQHHLRFLVFEDADVAFEGREQKDEGFMKGVTFSGLLNAIDGLSSGESRILFMTTNHIEKLDPALIRPGRIDLLINVDLLDSNQTERMYNRFFDDGNSFEFITQFTGQSAAAAQEHLVKRYFGTDVPQLPTFPALPVLPLSMPQYV